MSITLKNPAGLAEVPLYRHVSIASGSKMVFMAGQVSVDQDGNTVGAGDYVAQVEQCYLNVATALAEAGATFDDVAKINVYAVNMTPELVAASGEGIARAEKKLGVTIQAPLTGIGVAALASPEYLVEVDAIAFID
ncbi:RidA family protein [Kineosporia mesophila]|uniref:RidA family protein n=1 Tax=Kineosporia mesophila TaxID=566012 RepID=A0ABP7AVG5_9ACTN|nr:RidA family protein [Kineosporia mesophila]MCD5354075.1 RidA family protein [Kineosporia mesophila]